MAALQFQQQVFRAAAHATDLLVLGPMPASFGSTRQRRRGSCTASRVINRPVDVRRDAAAGGFDFGQFRHGQLKDATAECDATGRSPMNAGSAKQRTRLVGRVPRGLSKRLEKALPLT